MHITLDEAETLVKSVFEANGVLSETAQSVARALVNAEAVGQYGHGLRRIPAYVGQAHSGKVNGKALPLASRPRPAVLSIDAGLGYAYPALDIAVAELPAIARQQGIAIAVIHRSHHAGVMALTVERLAEQGIAAIMFANAPASMAPWGGRRRFFGTNPIAFAAPMAGGDPVIIDLALSKVAMGKVMAARQKGTTIPDNWAFGTDGKPTTDPTEAINGTLMPSGEAKGAALALMVELLAAGLTGGTFAHQASSLLESDGPAPSLGHMIIAIDPVATGGSDAIERIAYLAEEMVREDGVRLPGRRGQNSRRAAIENGLEIEDDVIASIRALF